jgi:Site-specific recombinase XerD
MQSAHNAFTRPDRAVYVSAVPDQDVGWAGAITGFLTTLRAAGRSPETVKLRATQLGRAAAAFPAGPWTVSGPELREWVASHGWSRETLRMWRAAFRSFYGWAVAEGLIEVDPSRALPSVRPAPPNPRPIPEKGYRVALGTPDERIYLMVRLAAELGLRRSEVAQAAREDLERDLYGFSLIVHGKGGKVRRVPVDDGLALAIERQPAGFLFPGRIDGHLSARYVGKLVARTLPDAWTMHSLRHRFGTVAYAVEHDLITVSELMGHASVATTRIYVAVPAEAARRTVAAVARL